jgi:LysM repeat protein
MAAPVIAIAGVVVGTPQFQGVASAATTASTVHGATAARTVSAVHAASTAKAVKATLDAVTTSDRTYEVQSGDTLSGIADRFYGSYGDWQWLYEQNTATVSDPNLIYPGQVLQVPYGVSGSASQGSAASHSNDTSQASTPASTVTTQTSTATTSTSGSSGALSGTLGCSGLEQLWDEAGGNPTDAFMAAEIAMAESSGNQYATDYDSNGTEDEGYWQINTVNGALATYDPLGNAESAVSLSGDGSDWTPWTTYTSGAYYGQC